MGKPGMLQFMWLETAGHDLGTEQQVPYFKCSSTGTTHHTLERSKVTLPQKENNSPETKPQSTGYCILVLVTQSCLTLCNPMNCSLPGSSVHGDSPGKNTGVGCHVLFSRGIFPTQESNPGLPHCRQILYCLSHQGSPRILEWVAYPFSRGTF